MAIPRSASSEGSRPACTAASRFAVPDVADAAILAILFRAETKFEAAVGARLGQLLHHRNDRRRGRQTDFRNFSPYQKATQDYSSKLGDRELYRRYYREGFENGYADGYNGN